MSDVTRILEAVGRGDAQATDELLPILYEELRLLAARKISREAPGQTLQATALVHEAYLRLIEGSQQNWDNRRHFFSAAAEAMRRILVEKARSKRRAKRGGDRHRVELDDAVMALEGPSDNIIALDEALTRLTDEDKTIGELVRLRYFAGLTLEQIAQMLGIPRRTVDRYWAYARAWLYQEVTEDGKAQGT